MNDWTRGESRIMCRIHGKPIEECHHPQLGGEVADASKPVSQQQRLQGGHLRSFVVREEIVPNPTPNGIRGEGAPDEWARQQQQLPVTPLKFGRLNPVAKRPLADFDRAWPEQDAGTRHNQWHRWDHTRFLRAAPPVPGFQCRDCPTFVSEAEFRAWVGPDFHDEPGRIIDAIVSRRAVRTEFVSTLEQEMRNRGDGLVDVRERTVVRGADGEVDEALTARYHDGKAEGLRLSQEMALEREILDELHRSVADLGIPPFDAEAARGRALIADSERRIRAVADGTFWDLSYLGHSITTEEQQAFLQHLKARAPYRRPSWWARHVTWPLLRLRAWLTKSEARDG